MYYATTTLSAMGSFAPDTINSTMCVTWLSNKFYGQVQAATFPSASWWRFRGWLVDRIHPMRVNLIGPRRNPLRVCWFFLRDYTVAEL